MDFFCSRQKQYIHSHSNAIVPGLSNSPFHHKSTINFDLIHYCIDTRPMGYQIVQMLNQLKKFLSRSPPPANPRRSSACTHPYCAHFAQCLKTLGEESLSHYSHKPFSSHHSLPTLISNHFSTNDIDYDWDSDYGWAVFCHRCHQERCKHCERAAFTQVTKFGELLTFENREVWICAPCRHRKCPGRKLRLVSECAMCGHGVCGECLLAGDEKAGMACCRCGKKKRRPENSLYSSKAEASTKQSGESCSGET